MSYIISLDELDLNYLTLSNYIPGDKVKPLFDLRHTRADDYVEFQIIPSADDAYDDTTSFSGTWNQSSEGSALKITMCHICNLKIPSCYFLEHLRSTKHTTLKSIIDKALDRLNKFLIEDTDITGQEQPLNSYFCEVCCLVLHRNEKENHEKSQHHAQELKKERNVQDVLCLLTSNTSDSDEVYVAGISMSDSTISPNNFKEKDELVSEIPKSQMLNPSQESLSEIGSSQMTSNYSFPIAQMLADDIDIVLHSGRSVKVPTDNIHGFIKVTDNVLISLICQSFINNTIESKEMHIKRCKTHINTEFNGYFLRRIWGSKEIYHCIICNEITADVNEHINSFMHKYYKNDISCELHEDVKETQDDIDQRIFLYDHNFVVKTKNDAICNYYYHLYIKDDGFPVLFCRICKIQIANNTEVAHDHVNSDTHRTRYEAVTACNGIKKVKDYFECLACLEIVKEGNELSHINNPVHKTKLQNLPEAESKSEVSNLNPSNSKQERKRKSKRKRKEERDRRMELFQNERDEIYLTLLCEICNTEVPNIDACINEHLSSEQHITKYNNGDRDYYIDIILNRVCQVGAVTIDEEKKTDDIQTRTHIIKLQQHIKAMLKLKFLDTYCNHCNFKYNTKPFMKFLHNVYHDVTINGIPRIDHSRREYQCTVCNEDESEFYSNDFYEVTHMLHTFDKIELKTKDFCNDCKINVPKSPITEDLHNFIHENGGFSNQSAEVKIVLNAYNSLKSLMKSVLKYGYYCELCKKNIVDSACSKNRHATSPKHRIKLLRMKNRNIKDVVNGYNHLYEKKSKITIICVICNAIFLNNNESILIHFTGHKHKKTYASFLRDNKIKKLIVNYFCDLCKVYLDLKKEFEHSLTKCHKLKKQK